MAIKTINFQSKRFISTYACQPVVLCLTPIWRGRVTDSAGLAIAFGTIDNGGRYLGSDGYAFPPRWENPRGEEDYQYTVLVDDAQFEIDPETDLPYELTCADINDISADACLWGEVIFGLNELAA